MYLQDRYVLLTQQINESYDYMRFLQERISKLEEEFDEVSHLMGFMQNLTESDNNNSDSNE